MDSLNNCLIDLMGRLDFLVENFEDDPLDGQTKYIQDKLQDAASAVSDAYHAKNFGVEKC